MSVTCKFITINDCKVKMPVNTGADSTVISSKIWSEPGKPQLVVKTKHLDDVHQLALLGSFICDVEWKGSRQTQKKTSSCAL